MKILVTGAAGFIGANLVERLLADGHEVVAFDNLSQGTLLNLERAKASPKFRFLQGDVRDVGAMNEATQGCSTMYHLAAFKIPRFENAYDTLMINTKGTENAIEACVKHKTKLIFSSTSDVYGKNPDLPFTEESDLVLGPPTVRRWAYAISKAFDEQLIFAERERRGLDFVIVRFFGGYGPCQHLSWWGGPQSVFIDQALQGKPLTVHGDGQQTRSLTFVADHIEGLVRAMERPQAVGQVFNLGNDREITMEGLARMIWSMVRPGEEPMIERIPYESFGKYQDVRRRIPELTRSREVLGFTPKWELEQGLPLTIEWQKARRAAAAQ